MKQVTYTLFLILIYLICSSPGCSEDEAIKEQREQRLLIELQDSIKNMFESDSVSDKVLESFELSARHKLVDFADYLKIVSDTSLDIHFRLQADKMISHLFKPGKIETGSWCKVYSENNLNTLKKLLDRGLSKGFPLWVSPIQIEVETPLTLLNDSTYAGTLSFIQKCIMFNRPDTSEDVSDRLSIDIFITKRIKSFGEEQFKVWELYLGDII